MKISGVGAMVFHTDGQTDIMKLTVDFRKIANVPKNESVCLKNVSMK